MALGGWLKLHRSLADHPVASDPSSLAVWMHLLMQANHAETKRQINGRIVTLAPGQLIASRKSLAARTGVQESKVERILKMLESEQQIEQRGTSKYRVISILNWGSYQTDEQQAEQQLNNRRTAGEQQVNTPEEVSISPNGDTDTQEGKEGEEKSIGHSAEPRDRNQAQWVAELVSRGVNKKHATDWLKIRKQKKLPLTDTALDLIACEAMKAGFSLGEAIERAAAESWAGFKAGWLTKESGPGKQALAKHTGFDQRDYHQGLFEKEDGSYGF